MSSYTTEADIEAMRAEFESTLRSYFTKAADALGQYELDEGNLYFLWGRAWEAAIAASTVHAELARVKSELSAIASELHYPECWDTVAYQTLFDAIRNWVRCNKCNEGQSK